MNKLLLRFVVITLFLTIAIVAYLVVENPCFAGSCNEKREPEKIVTQESSPVSASEFKRRLTEARDPHILDVRTPEEFLAGHLANALNSDIYDPKFQEKISRLDRDAEWFVYCRSGNRSRQAVLIMKSLGFTKITELQGGILSWEGELVQ